MVTLYHNTFSFFLNLKGIWSRLFYYFQLYFRLRFLFQVFKGLLSHALQCRLVFLCKLRFLLCSLEMAWFYITVVLGTEPQRETLFSRGHQSGLHSHTPVFTSFSDDHGIWVSAPQHHVKTLPPLSAHSQCLFQSCFTGSTRFSASLRKPSQHTSPSRKLRPVPLVCHSNVYRETHPAFTGHEGDVGRDYVILWVINWPFCSTHYVFANNLF